MTYLVAAWSFKDIHSRPRRRICSMAHLQRYIDRLASHPDIDYITIRIEREVPKKQISLDMRA